MEERCEAIKAAADEAVAKLMQQLKMQLLQLPKKVRQDALNAAGRYMLLIPELWLPTQSSRCWTACCAYSVLELPLLHNAQKHCVLAHICPLAAGVLLTTPT